MGKKKINANMDTREIIAGLSDYQKGLLLTMAMIDEYGLEAVKEKYFSGKAKNELALSV